MRKLASIQKIIKIEPIEGADKIEKALRIGSVSNWHLLDVQPPDELVEVQDENGNMAKAYPTYYPFKLGENKTGRKWGSEVIHCEPYWDGGWMIECEGLESNIDSNIVRWRACT